MQNVLPVDSEKFFIDQNHLDHSKKINFGSYYTGREYVSVVWNFIRPLIRENSVVLDSSCGYGNFLKHIEGARVIGNDIDQIAADMAKKNNPSSEIHSFNALTNLDRNAYGISSAEKLIIVGNPPYNDTTSIIRNGIKKQLFEIDKSVYSRDLGISFLLSYQKLEADYVCVLHPLSYLIKKANFAALKAFANSYRLIDGIIIGSGVFTQTSKSMQFPILVALYEKHLFGMDYSYIERHVFKTIEGKSFVIKELDFIRNYISKYPSKTCSYRDDDLFFYTMRDLNALKRNKTFLDGYCSNAIVINKSKLDYYIYVDAVKDYANVFPYYLGNFDVLINQRLFSSYKNHFISYGLAKHSFLRKFYDGFESHSNYAEKITEYFKSLLGEHYVEGNNN